MGIAERSAMRVRAHNFARLRAHATTVQCLALVGCGAAAAVVLQATVSGHRVGVDCVREQMAAIFGGDATSTCTAAPPRDGTGSFVSARFTGPGPELEHFKGPAPELEPALEEPPRASPPFRPKATFSIRLPGPIGAAALGYWDLADTSRHMLPDGRKVVVTRFHPNSPDLKIEVVEPCLGFACVFRSKITEFRLSPHPAQPDVYVDDSKTVSLRRVDGSWSLELPSASTGAKASKETPPAGPPQEQVVATEDGVQEVHLVRPDGGRGIYYRRVGTSELHPTREAARAGGGGASAGASSAPPYEPLAEADHDLVRVHVRSNLSQITRSLRDLRYERDPPSQGAFHNVLLEDAAGLSPKTTIALLNWAEEMAAVREAQDPAPAGKAWTVDELFVMRGYSADLGRAHAHNYPVALWSSGPPTHFYPDLPSDRMYDEAELAGWGAKPIRPAPGESVLMGPRVTHASPPVNRRTADDFTVQAQLRLVPEQRDPSEPEGHLEKLQRLRREAEAALRANR